MTVTATPTRPMSVVQGHVMEKDHPAATAIITGALASLTMGSAMSAVQTSIVLVHVLALNQMVTATSILAAARTLIVDCVIDTEQMLEFRAHVLE